MRRVTLRNAPAFCGPEVWTSRSMYFLEGEADIAYGGMHYVIVDASSAGLALDPARGREIAALGR